MTKVHHTLGVFSAIAFAAVAQCNSAAANPIINTDFNIDVVMGTDTFEAAGGATLFTENDLFTSNTISPGLTSQIESDSGVPSYIAANIGNFNLVSDGIFLSTTTPDALLNISVNVVQHVDETGLPSPAALIQDLTSVPFDGSTTVDLPDFLYNNQYFLTGSVGDQEYVGTINVNFYALDVTETQAAAVPEPSSLSLLAAGFLSLFALAHRNGSKRR